MSLLDAVATVVDLATYGDSLWLTTPGVDVHCLLIVEYFDSTRSRILGIGVATLSMSTCPSMKVYHHVLIFLEWWQWLVSSNSMYFPCNLWSAFGIADTLCWKTAKLAMNVALRLVVVRLGWGSRIRQTVAAPKSKTAPPNGTRINKACASCSNNYLY